MRSIWLVVVFCLVGVMSTIDAQASRNTRRGQQLLYRSRQDDCSGNLKSFYGSMKLYAAVNDGQLPAKDNFAGLSELMKHGISYGNFYCRQFRGKKYKFNDNAKEKKKVKSKDRFTEENSPFIYWGGINLTSAIKHTPKLVVMCDKANSRHLNVLLADGSVVSIEPEKGDAKIKNTADIVEALNRKYQYPAGTLRVLRSKAKKMDAIFSK